MKNSNNSTEHMSYIDSLKGISILGIIAVHSGLGHQQGVFSDIGKIGANGVQLFFIISAYLMCYSLENNPVKDFQQWRFWMKKKFIRIAPLYYMALVIAWIETSGTGNMYWTGGKPITIGNILSHLFFVNGVNPFWINSIISVEWYVSDLMLLYALYPIIGRYIHSLKTAETLTMISIVTAFVFNHGIDKLFNLSNNEITRTYVYNFGIVNQFQVMCFGILAFYLIKEIKENKIILNKMSGYMSLFLGLYIIAGVMFNRGLRVTSIYVFLAFGFMLIFIGTDITRCRIIDNKGFSKIGKYSYGIYLFHYTLIDYFYKKRWLINGCRLSEYIYKFALILIISILISIVCETVLKIVCLWIRKIFSYIN